MLPNLELAARRAPADLVPLLESAADSARRASELVRKLMTYAGRNRPGERTIEEMGSLASRAVELCRTTFDRRITLERSYEAGARAGWKRPRSNRRCSISSSTRATPWRARRSRRRASPSGSRRCAPALTSWGDRGRDHVRIRVRDNGVGMDDATVQRIYEPFFTTKDIGKGTGLSLATTRAIVQDHGGFVVCESAKGAGTTFAVYVPLEPEVPGRERAPSERPPAPGTEMVLVVDDEPAVRKVVSRMLESGRYTSREAASGTEALELLANRAFRIEGRARSPRRVDARPAATRAPEPPA